MPQRILLACAIFGVSSAGQYPDIPPCNQDDIVCLTGNSNTLYKMSVAGNPSLNIENLDPINYGKLIGNLPSIKYMLYLSKGSGLSECKVVETSLNLKESTFKLDLFCPTFDLYGCYKVNGHLITLPVEGNGYFIVIGRDYRIHIDAKIKVNQNQDGEKYMSLESFEVDGHLEGTMNTDAISLDYGKRDVVKMMRDFINNNYKAVVKELQGPVLEENVRRLIKNINKYLKTIPLHQLIVQ